MKPTPVNSEKAIQKCKEMIISQNKAVLMVCKDLNKIDNFMDGWEQYIGVEIYVHAATFPKAQLVIPIEAYNYLCKTKTYRLAIAKDLAEQVIMSSPDVLDNVSGSVTTDGKKVNVSIALKNIRYENKPEGIEEQDIFF